MLRLDARDWSAKLREGMQMNDRLRQAMVAANVAELEDEGDARRFGREAVSTALTSGQDEEELRRRDVEAQRQRDLDAALGDVIEIVARHRKRLGRQVCSPADGRATRQIHELLRGMAADAGGADHDPSFQ